MPVRPEANSPHSHRRPAPARKYGRRAAAMTATGTLVAGGLVLGAAPAVAADRDVANASGRFLSGTVAGTNLDTILAIAGVKAKNDGSPSSVTERDTLNATVLNAISLPLPGGLHLLEDNGLLTLGAVSQYARANSDGSSRGASGAVTNSGAIDVGGSSGAPANATLDLDGLLPGGVTSALADVDVEIGALSAVATQAKGKHGNQVGDYQIADLVVTLESPLLAGLLGTLGTGITGGAADGLLGGLPAALNVIALLGGAGSGVTGLGGLDLDALLGGFDTTLGSGPLTVDLTTGTIRVDLDALLNLNNLPPNTDIVPLLANILTTQVPDLITAELEDLTESITDAIDGVGITGGAIPIPGLDGLLDGALAPLLAQLLGTVNTVTGLVDANGATSLLGGTGLLDGALDGVLDLVANVQQNRNNDGVFTQRALRVGLLDTVNVNLASATVGPNEGPAGSSTLGPPVITEPDDGDETTDRTPPISGNGKPGYTVTVKEDGRTICKDEVNSDGKWKCTPSSKMSLGKHTITATQSNGTRTSGKSNSVTFKIVESTGLPATGGNDSTVPIAAAGLGLLLSGAGLMAGNRRGSSGAHAKRGRHARI